MATYDLNIETFGGTSSNPSTFTDGDLPLTLLDAAKTGYTFVSWHTDSHFVSPEIAIITEAGEESIFAQYTINDYTLEFTDHDDTVLQTADYEFGTDLQYITAPADPTRVGYDFAGWDIPIPATMPGADTTIQATYTLKESTISFESNGGTAVTAITADEGTAVSAPTPPTKEGYTFDNWYNEVGLSTAYVFSTMPAEDTIAYAGWTAVDYTITYEENGGSVVAPNVAGYETAVVAPTPPTKADLTFAGWYTDDATFLVPYVFDTMPLDGITIYAKWDATLTFVSNGGSAEVAQVILEGTAPTEPADPTYPGYTFGGWFTDDSSFLVAANFATVLTADEVFYAKFTVISYAAEYLDWDGAVLQTADYEFGADTSGVTPPADPTRTGWTFTAWDSVAPATMPVDGITITATYTIDEVTMTFVTNGGDAIAPITQDYGTAVVSPTPIYIGFTFVGWYEEVGLTTPYTITTMPAADLSLYAKYTEDTYTITYLNVLGIANGNPATYEEADNPITFVVPTVTIGYTFVGWFTEPVGGTEVTVTTDETVGSFTLYAQWSRINDYIALPQKSVSDTGTKVNLNYITRVGILKSGASYHVLVTVDGILNNPKDYILYKGYSLEAEALVARDTFLASVISSGIDGGGA